MQIHPGGGNRIIGDPSLFDLFLGEMVPLSQANCRYQPVSPK